MRSLLILLLSIMLLEPAALFAAEAESMAVIIGRAQPSKGIDSVELSLIYWRKKLYWPDGKRIQPVNLSADSSLRRQFSLSILASPPETQTDYWNDLYFHGTSPPHVINSQEAMLRFVAETPGAIGYINACRVDNRVKAVLWINADGTTSSSSPALNCN